MTYRCRRMFQPKIPQPLSELDIQLSVTISGMHFIASIFRGDDSGFIFFSVEIIPTMLDISEICLCLFTVRAVLPGLDDLYRLWSTCTPCYTLSPDWKIWSIVSGSSLKNSGNSSTISTSNSNVGLGTGST